LLFLSFWFVWILEPLRRLTEARGKTKTEDRALPRLLPLPLPLPPAASGEIPGRGGAGGAGGAGEKRTGQHLG
jgi:hypothetical protein